jgi:hypothetical protein
MPPQEPIQNVAPVSNQFSSEVLPPKPKIKLVSLIIACLVGLVTVLIVYWAANYAISFWATFYCTGWNEGSGQVTSCSIPGIENWANNGYGMMLMAAFTLGLIYFIPALIALVCSVYWFKKIRDWKNENIPTKLFVWVGLAFSALSLLAFIAPVVWFPISVKLSQQVLQTELTTSHQELSTATTNQFVCPDQNSLEVDANNIVWEHSFGEGDSSHQTTRLGTVDATAGTFTWQDFGYVQNDLTTQLVSRYQDELQTCKNANAKSIFELYKEISSTGFYK